MSKYLEFRTIIPPAGITTKRFEVRSIKAAVPLGLIRFSPTWRRYVFNPLFNTEFDAACLNDIRAFIGRLMLERKGIDLPEDETKEEFVFEQTSENGGKITYRCISFVIITDNGSDVFVKPELDLLNEMVDTLNQHFDHKDEPEEE